jgi:NF-kappa-B-activating protein
MALKTLFRAIDPSHPAGKRKEIDNVMKKARQQPANEYWNKKILEVEEKDPNRWKHTGFKKMYVNGVRKSRSRSPRKPPLSPRSRPPPSPVRRRPSRTPERYKPRSPPLRYARDLPKSKEAYRTGKNRPISPPPKVNKKCFKTVHDSFGGCFKGCSHPINLQLFR